MQKRDDVEPVPMCCKLLSLLKGSPEDLSSRGFLLLCHTAVLRASASVNKL